MLDLPQSAKRSNRLDNNELFDSETEPEMTPELPPRRARFHEKIPFFKTILTIILIQFVIFFIFSFILSKDQALSILKLCESVFISQYNSNFLGFFLFYFLICFVSIACVIPTISVAVILLTLVSKSIVQTWTITLVNYLIIESGLFFAFRGAYKHRIDGYVKNFRYAPPFKHGPQPSD